MVHGNMRSHLCNEKTDPLVVSMDRLNRILAADRPGEPRKWVQAVDKALARVEGALQQDSLGALAPGGTLDQVGTTEPRLSRQADTVSRDYQQLLEQSASLREEVRCTIDPMPSSRASALRQRVEEFLVNLEKTHRAQALLLIDSLATDIGGED